jgi:hypothetical protein
MHCGLTDGQAGVMRAIDSLRDAEQHWILVTEEDVLYLHARGLVTAVDEVLKGVFSDDLTSHLPVRVLPVSAETPSDIDFLVDREFRKIAELLAPGRRARDEARGRIRTLLFLQAQSSSAQLGAFLLSIQGNKYHSHIGEPGHIRTSAVPFDKRRLKAPDIADGPIICRSTRRTNLCWCEPSQP